MLYYVLISLALFFSPLLRADSPQLSRRHVRQAMEEILSYHVETQSVTPQVMQRAIKNFVNKFDPGKVYLLEREIAPFLNLSRPELKRMVAAYHRDELDTFLALNQVIAYSIERGARMREEIMREIIVQRGAFSPPRQETYLQYAPTERELRKRLKGQVLQFYAQLQKEALSTNPKAREKILAFLSRKVKGQEAGYYAQDQDKLAMHAVKAMAKSLDSHTAYYTPQEAQELRTMLVKEFKGVGVILVEDPDGISVARLIPGGPADRSGKIFTGDRVEAINKASVGELTYEEVLKMMKQGNEVTLSLIHSDGTRHQITLKKERIELADERVKCTSVPFGGGIIGQITLPGFYGGAVGSSSEQDMIQALRQLKQQGALQGLIIDLRENSGGFLSEAVKVASLFVKSGVIVVSKYGRGEVEFLRDVDPRVYYDGPLILLTSQASASAAEILAQALQDYGIALVVGDARTYGKGSIQYQTITDPNAKNYYKVTIGRYYTVSGRSTQISGVRADIVVPTKYSSLKIGERYLEYPLAADRIDAAFVDPLIDIKDSSRQWFQRYYLPNLQQRTSYWRQMIPPLEQNSSRRIATNKNYQLFLKALKKEPVSSKWGDEDLQMAEAFEIMRDMITLHQEKIALR